MLKRVCLAVQRIVATDSAAMDVILAEQNRLVLLELCVKTWGLQL